MHKYISFIVLLLLFSSCKTKSTFVSLQTTEGEIIVKLYEETPLHKDNFISLVEDGYYDSLLFHRVIDEFMIQSGDPNSKNAEDGQLLGNGGPDYKVDAEFNDSLFHKKGALAAAHDGNPEKSSAGSQFYIVEGKVFNEEQLKRIEESKDITYTDLQRETYQTIGGYPPLDQNYTVFGEVVKGIKVVEAISEVETNRKDRPVENVRILKAEVIKFKEE